MVRMSSKNIKLILSAAVFASFTSFGALTGDFNGDAAYAGEVKRYSSGGRSQGGERKVRTVRRSVLDGNYNKQRSNRNGASSVRYGRTKNNSGANNRRNRQANAVPVFNNRNTNRNANTNTNRNTNTNTNRNVNNNNNVNRNNIANTNTIVINNNINNGSDRSGARLGKRVNKSRRSIGSYNDGQVHSVMRRATNNPPVRFNEIAGGENSGSVTNIYERNNVVDFGTTIIYGNSNFREAAGNGGGVSVNNCRYGTYCTINLGGPKIITFNDVPDYDDGLADENLSEKEYKKKYGSK